MSSLKWTHIGPNQSPMDPRFQPDNPCQSYRSVKVQWGREKQGQYWKFRRKHTKRKEVVVATTVVWLQCKAASLLLFVSEAPLSPPGVKVTMLLFMSEAPSPPGVKVTITASPSNGFLESIKSLNLPPKTLISWYGLAFAHLWICHPRP
jgi:hypothetical protein